MVFLPTFPLPKETVASQDKEPAKPGAAQNCTLRQPALGVPRQVCAADKVCARGTQEFPAPCKWNSLVLR